MHSIVGGGVNGRHFTAWPWAGLLVACGYDAGLTMASGHTAAIIFAGLGAVLFSAKAIVVKLSYQHGSDAATVLALRMLFAMPFFWAAVWWELRRKQPAAIVFADKLRLWLLGFIGYYVSSYLDFWGLEYISVGLERIILYLNPTLVLLISAFVLKKHIRGIQWVAMLVAYAGVLVVFAHDVQTQAGEGVVFGGVLVFLCALSYAVYLIMAGEVVSRVGSIRTVAHASTSATVFCIAHAIVADPTAMLTESTPVYQLAIFNAALCTFVPRLLTMVAVNRVGSSLTAQAGAVGPVATVYLGWAFLGEPITLTQLVGMTIVLASVALLLRVNNADKLKPIHPDSQA